MRLAGSGIFQPAYVNQRLPADVPGEPETPSRKESTTERNSQVKGKFQTIGVPAHGGVCARGGGIHATGALRRQLKGRLKTSRLRSGEHLGQEA